MYIASTNQQTFYNYSVVCKTKKEALLELEKFWNSKSNMNYDPIPFKEAFEEFGFMIQKIELNKTFEI